MPEALRYLDAVFPLHGTSVPLDHGYALFGAISRVLPAVHGDNTWSIFPVRGRHVSPGRLELTQKSRLRLRVPADDVGVLTPLIGSNLELDGFCLTVGPPVLYPLKPATALEAHIVVIKGFAEPQAFHAAVQRQVEAMPDLGQDPGQISTEVGPRRILRAGTHQVVGFAVMVSGLEVQASLAIQSLGLGGRRHIGAGCFFPLTR